MNELPRVLSGGRLRLIWKLNPVCRCVAYDEPITKFRVLKYEKWIIEDEQGTAFTNSKGRLITYKTSRNAAMAAEKHLTKIGLLK